MPRSPEVIETDRARAWLLTASADPETAARYLQSFETRHPDVVARIISSSFGLQALIAIFANSRFLSEELMQHPEWIEDVVTSQELYRSVSTDEMIRKLEENLSDDAPVHALALAEFRRRQLLRILLRDVFGLATLGEVTEEISNVADAILDVTYRRIRSQLVRRYGRPRYIDPEGSQHESGFSVLALGKLGGRELNYSSDIDLMFVYSANGDTDGEQQITNREFFKKLANNYTELLSTYTPEGMCYRVDLRLRPDGRHGEVCISLDGAKNYYLQRARDWELQMLIKARVAAGEPEPGRELLEAAEQRIYSSSLDFSAVEAVSLTRERIHEKLAAKRSSSDSGLDIKLTRGGIRDIEFLVQCLQRLHGGREHWVRHAGTMLALVRLNDKDLISAAEYSRLTSAYQFLRHLEHRLQFEDDRQTHVLPVQRERLEILARRMPENELGRGPSAEKLLHQLNTHLEEVQGTYDRVIHSQQPLYFSAPATPRSEPVEIEPVFEQPAGTNLVRFLDQRAPEIAAVLQSRPLRRGVKSFEAFLERIVDDSGFIGMLNQSPGLTANVIDIFENSPWFAEELVRRPSLLPAVEQARQKAPPASLSGDDAAALRLFFRREMLRIQAGSICGPAGIFDTLGETSDLADTVVSAAYTLAVRHVLASHPPAGESYQPGDQMMVIALGRLGMREFDLGSDADLNFVLPDEEAGEIQFWTRVAERMVDIISAYTGEGMMFAVDTRLRPNGREGTLVQTISSYYEYVEHRAEAWEGITYMKSRCIAGNAKKSSDFLHELQQVDWRRYGQSGRSRNELREMRLRLEREQGQNNPLKAGPGGFYDIDFSLMYLRLKSAGIFFRVLNTPERIDIIEKMGHLDREDAAFLRDAATLYRAIDHAMRIYSGHAEGKLPHSSAQLAALTELVHRWTPEHFHREPLPEQMEDIRRRIRDYFHRIFG